MRLVRKKTWREGRVGAWSTNRVFKRSAFALAEVMLGVLIFSIGIIALGRTVSNCVNASALSADDARVRQILANRMIEIETTPGQPDKSKEFKIDTGFGIVKLVQKAAPQEMKEKDGTELTGIIRVTLTANWSRGGSNQSKQIAFYVYRL
jgi:Tfp pilus assembly protein PilV